LPSGDSTESASGENGTNTNEPYSVGSCDEKQENLDSKSTLAQLAITTRRLRHCLSSQSRAGNFDHLAGGHMNITGAGISSGGRYAS
jgi:hypothetical protein